MGAETAKQILHQLLDACERRDDPAARAISIGVGRLPGYLDERDPSVRIGVNQALAGWEAQGWVRLRWVKGERGNLLDRVTLCLEAVPQIYAYLGRAPVADQQAQFLSLLDYYMRQISPACQVALRSLAEKARAGHSTPPFSLADPARNQDILRALAALDSLEEEIPERVLSARLLGDSKHLAALKPALIALLRQAHPEWVGLREDDIWLSLGVLPNPGHIFLHGPLVFDLAGTRVDLRAFDPDLGLPAHAIARLNLVELPARYVLTVENQTSFYDHIRAFPQDGLVLYLGGFPGRARRLLLRRLAEFAPDVPLYHWGDLDYGGFAILSYLRQLMPCPVIAHQMDLAAIQQPDIPTKPLNQIDRRNLGRLLHDVQLVDNYPVIEALLVRNIKIEQESFQPQRCLDL